MKPGTKPKPIVLRRIEGDPNRKRTDIDEPQPNSQKITPRAPDYLDDIAKKEWKRVACELHRLGLLTDLDISALAGYCQSFSMWVDAIENIKKHGKLIKAQSGFPVQSPYVGIANKSMAEMRKWQAEFGMTPSSRTRLAIDKNENKKPKGQDLLT